MLVECKIFVDAKLEVDDAIGFQPCYDTLLYKKYTSSVDEVHIFILYKKSRTMRFRGFNYKKTERLANVRIYHCWGLFNGSYYPNINHCNGNRCCFIYLT